MACGIIMLKDSDTGIILKQLDNVPRKNFISVALGIQIPFDNDEISVKAISNDRPDQNRIPIPKTISFKYAIVGKTFISPMAYSNPTITSMNGKPQLLRQKNAVPLLPKPALVCTCPINTIYAVTSRQNTTSIWTTCTYPTLAQAIALSLGRYTVVMCTMRVCSCSCGSLEVIVQVCVPNIAVLANRRDARTSATWSIFRMPCYLKTLPKVSNSTSPISN